MTADPVAAARAAFARRDWQGARAAYAAARAAGELDPDDLYADADAAWWLGQVNESVAGYEQAHRRYREQGRDRPAALAAVMVGVNLLLRGDAPLGSGWLGRAQRLLAGDRECYEYGLLRYLTEVEARLVGGEALTSPATDEVAAAARQVRELGHRCGSPDLVVFGLVGEGRALIRQGRAQTGLALLDEALVSVVTDELRPDMAGNAYCHLMAAAHELVDVQRARDWTEATTRWLAGLPAAVLFTGICQVHRAQVHQAGGDWEAAAQEAARVGVDLVDIQPGVAAEGHYQLGEIRRLRGDVAGAEQTYQRAHRLGRDPQPGLALLRLAQGRVAAALASIRAALLAEDDRLARARLCAAQVEIAIAAGDPGAARKAGDELADTAADYGTAGLVAMAQQARGAVLLADGHPEEALPVLRDSCRRWQELRMPYECARVRALLAWAYREVGDPGTAAQEQQAATEAFDRLGAAPQLRAAAGAGGSAGAPDAGLAGGSAGLTAREVGVLRLVAAGRSNRQVASALFISEKTVARHLSNIFTKLGVESRTEAASYAYTHGLAGAADG